MRLGDDRHLGRGEPDAVVGKLVGPFEIVGRPGEGSIGSVYLAVLDPGAVVAIPDSGSRYQLGDKLGTGGMAEVFLGTMVGAEGFVRRVAIKRVLSELSQVPAFAAMFIAEARIASQLAHPNIVTVLDFSRDRDGRLLLVMEYVEGRDLATLLGAGALPPSLAIFIVVELLRGLGYAHDLPDASGVIHRDVSPQNVLLSYEGAVKISDFGLAKALSVGGVRSETVRGKPSYMSPEQAAGKPLDARTDLFAVGVMLWEMLAQRPLFAGTTTEILGQVMFRDIAAPSSVRPEVPIDLEAVAMRLLARNRDDRYPTAEAAIEALLCCAAAPRDGRGELTEVLAERFPRASGSRSRRRCGSRQAAAPAAPAAPGLGAGPITVPRPVTTARRAMIPSISRILPPRRRLFAATLSGMVLGGVAAAVVAWLSRG